MIVTRDNYQSVIEILKDKSILAVDTETTGLRVHHGDRLFAIIFCDGEESYYFNFNKNDLNYPEHSHTVLDLNTHLSPLADILSGDKLFVLANAKFDLHILKNEGLPTPKYVWDVLVMARIEDNTHMRYSLDEVAKRIHLGKDDEVSTYIKNYRLFTKETVNGKDITLKHYDKVNFTVMSKYGMQDALITYRIYDHQLKLFRSWFDDTLGMKSIFPLVENEQRLTNVCFDIERRGFRIDRKYCEDTVLKLQFKIHNLQAEFFDLTGMPFVDSPKSLSISLGKVGILGGKTELGGASFTDDVLSKEAHRAARVVLEHRDVNKKLTSYFNQFLYHSDSNDYVHCNIKQSATKTGRFSITDPALQTIPSVDDDGTPEQIEYSKSVRRAFIPDKDCVLVAVDYKAFEFRAMLDLAGERELAFKIEQGLDPHQATADMVGISRKQAKTINFGLLFGMGQQKLADSLGMKVDDAAATKRKYFRALPNVKRLIYNTQSKAVERGFVWNIFNRRYFFHEAKFAYKAVNCLIQGGTADGVKKAMVEIDFLLKNTRSRITLQIHDELVFNIHKDELDLIPEIMEIMRNAYPSFFHKMDCSVEHSWKSWGDLEEGLPNGS
jgi:DNA polymerase-1